MKWTGLNELRESYLKFFESKGHTILPSFPLVPQGDKSILLINAGMTPLKKYFSGQETPPNTRLTTCQKCIRTPDIDNVGKTARHGTYFEMLGNFSFGDYFKKEAIAWGWEYFTKVLEIPEDLLWVSVYLEDDDARDIWVKEVGLPPERVVKMGKEDNFWEHGSGPCGPCSEIYFDRGEKYGCGNPDCKVGCDCDRYVEVWNIVFSQFDNDGNGNYTPLKNKNIDTGMGLERLACMVQGVDNIFMVDTVYKILNHITEIAGVKYGKSKENDISIRVITDHIRSTTFMVSDGVLPQNEGRGYVLRRLLRRAARHGRLLGIKEPFLYKICDTVIAENKSAYPELEEKAEYIKKVIKMEEERFDRTIGQGMELLNSIIEKIDNEDFGQESKILNGEMAFKLYDTFGFPIDLTKEIIAEKNIILNEKEFTDLMNEQRKRARDAVKSNSAFEGENNIFDELIDESSDFVGYDLLETNSTILAMGCKNKEFTEAKKGDNVDVVLDLTPFYAESGGQVADIGVISNAKATLKVIDVQKTSKGLFVHSCVVENGEISTGDEVCATVDKVTREAIMRNHTAAHLLQSALINTLSEHVHQAGQLVTQDRVRFDFNHFTQLTKEELYKIENEINQKILEGVAMDILEMSIDEAKNMGATALFGEKYGDVVRVVNVPGFSMELCGGTHVENTAKVGLFKIISESSVAAGVRRIEATTGLGILDLLIDTNKIINEAAGALKLSNPTDLANKVVAMQSEIKALDREIDKLQEEIVENKFSDIFGKANEINGIQFVAASFTGMKPDALRKIGDTIKDREKRAVAVLSTLNDGKTTVLCVCGNEALEKGVDANRIIKAITAVTGGGGGGKKDSAMAGIKDHFRLDEALIQIPDVIRSLV